MITLRTILLVIMLAVPSISPADKQELATQKDIAVKQTLHSKFNDFCQQFYKKVYVKSLYALNSLNFDIAVHTKRKNEVQLYEAVLKKDYARQQMRLALKKLKSLPAGKQILADIVKEESKAHLQHLQQLLSRKQRTVQRIDFYQQLIALEKKFPNDNKEGGKEEGGIKSALNKKKLSPKVLNLQEKLKGYFRYLNLIETAIHDVMNTLEKRIQQDTSH